MRCHTMTMPHDEMTMPHDDIPHPSVSFAEENPSMSCQQCKQSSTTSQSCLHNQYPLHLLPLTCQARSPQPGVLSQESAVRRAEPEGFSLESSASVQQESSAGTNKPQPGANCVGSLAGVIWQTMVSPTRCDTILRHGRRWRCYRIL